MLFIGNSLTAGVVAIPTIVDALVNSAGLGDPDIQRSTDGGETLEGHAARRDTQAFLKQAWDVVVLQEASSRTNHLGDRTLFYTAATKLAGAAQAANPDVRIILYETWAFAFPGSWVYPHYFPSVAAMQAEVRATYREAAENYIPGHTKPPLRVVVAPVGDAWEGHLREPEPLALHSKDSLHSTDAGKYLAALVLFSTIYGRPTAGLTAWKLEPQDAARLQRAADALRPAP